jgi:hypothetical protein
MSSGLRVMQEQLPSLISAFVSDLCGVSTIAGGSIAGFFVSETLSHLLRRIAESAREILLEELRSGEAQLPPAQIDEGIAIIYRYFRAAQEGAARLNLRLMAQTIAGQASLSALSASDFLRDADVLASLRRQEIFLLAKLHHAWSSDWLKRNEPSMQCKVALEWATCQLVPNIFRSGDEIEAVAGGLVRTGLVKVMPAIGNSTYMPTLLLDKLVAMAPIEAAILKEKSVEN